MSPADKASCAVVEVPEVPLAVARLGSSLQTHPAADLTLRTSAAADRAQTTRAAPPRKRRVQVAAAARLQTCRGQSGRKLLAEARHQGCRFVSTTPKILTLERSDLC